MPTIPILGRTGTLAIACYFFASRSGGGQFGGILRDAALAGAAISGYELGKDGKISGEVMGSVAPNVSGFASQI